MNYNVSISKMAPGQAVEGFYILKEAAARTTAAGKPFLSAALMDRTGEIAMLVWDYTGPITEADTGRVVKIRGEVKEYKGALQITASRIRPAGDGDEFDAEALVPTAPIDADAALERVRALAASLEDPDYRQMAEALLERNLEQLRSIPAAKSVHHAFLHGLLMHVSDMMELADFTARKYADVIDRSLLLTAVLAHDLRKDREFAFSELGLVTAYSTEGQLLGHSVMGAQSIAELAAELVLPAEKSLLLQHLLLSHHGQPEWGAAVRPMCAEAELLSYIDLIDSRMEICREALAETPVGAFSARIFALDGRRIYHHGAGTLNQ